MKDDGGAHRLLGGSVLASGVLFAVLGLASLAFDSQLALAQAADSLIDMLTASALLFALRVSRAPADEDHPFGHQSAQPVAALIVAVLAGVLAAEVLREAIAALVSGEHARIGPTLLAAIGAKAAVKLGFAVMAWRALRSRRSSALGAFLVDARNDVVVGVSSALGLSLAEPLGVPMLDAWLAIPVALWIAGSGVSLGRESANLLMGRVPDAARLEELRALAEGVAGVESVGRLHARHQGDDIHVWVEVAVAPELTVRAAHDIGEAVARRLGDEDDVCRADVHIDAAVTVASSRARNRSP